MSTLAFELNNSDGRARRGRVTLPRGPVETPVFMPVGTAGTVKGMWPRDLREIGTQISLANTYHLHITPGEKLVEKLGGLHKFMAMEWPLLTDSGGFQVFSLPRKKISEAGVEFEFKKGGDPIFASPEWSMDVQMALGADIVMAFDECAPYPCTSDDAEQAMHRTLRWLDRCKDGMTAEHQNLFGIIQGSVYEPLRRESAQETISRDLPGYAIGGVSVGEGHGLMMKAIDDAEPHMPKEKPRYLMGVGLPEDIVGAVGRGMDMFDCVIPTRYGRSGTCFTSVGRVRVTDRRYRHDSYPIDPSCSCPTCTQYSRGYIHHLLKTGELLGTMACTLHNVAYYHRLMADIRVAIEKGRYSDFAKGFDEDYVRQDRERRREEWVQGMFDTFAVGQTSSLPGYVSPATRDSGRIVEEDDSRRPKKSSSPSSHQPGTSGPKQDARGPKRPSNKRRR
ncbi:MAG: queuine tRNA-ribosyltransferase [Bradymonadia bacterium]|jgi:queuine tRNA-ribosyltransferase